MEYRNTLFDFIRRTEANLMIIEKGASKSKNEYFEVTQLLNSMLGLLMFPAEHDLAHVEKVELESIEGFKPPKLLHGRLREENIIGLIRYMRNSVAHYNVGSVDS